MLVTSIGQPGIAVVVRSLSFVVVVSALLTPVAGIAASLPNAPAATAAIEVFSPEGETKQVRQVTARFSTPMVTLGDPRLPDPFERTCPAPGNGRWADARNWVYDFDRDLPAGIRCAFTLRKDLKALNGAEVGGRQRFEFNTGGPAIVGSYPRDGSQAIDEEQIFLLKLDAPATVASVKAHVYCAVDLGRVGDAPR
jgi:alpha-2-macroglobulin